LIHWLSRGRAVAPAGAAVVFAPHPDDESLGCGGTIAMKRRQNIPVDIVVASDGGAAGPEIDRAALVAERKAEVYAAAEQLGVPAGAVHWLGFPDGALDAHTTSLRERAATILRARPAEEVFVPYERDGHPDHKATTKAVYAALGDVGRPVTVFQYPVWFWAGTWPWTSVRLGLNRGAWAQVRKIVREKAGWGALRLFGTTVNIEPVRDRKRAALAAHESQFGGKGYPGSLADFDDGHWLELFDQPVEWFRRSRFRPRRQERPDDRQAGPATRERPSADRAPTEREHTHAPVPES
jgi:LmbE family N-acetylglucosaminyl deacetylase